MSERAARLGPFVFLAVTAVTGHNMQKKKVSEAGGALRAPPTGDVFLAVTAVSRRFVPG